MATGTISKLVMVTYLYILDAFKNNLILSNKKYYFLGILHCCLLSCGNNETACSIKLYIYSFSPQEAVAHIFFYKVHHNFTNPVILNLKSLIKSFTENFR